MTTISPFSGDPSALLAGLPPAAVMKHPSSGMSYVSGHYIIATLNKCFGVTGWDYTLREFHPVAASPFKTKSGREMSRASARAVVRIEAVCPKTKRRVIKEGIGGGSSIARDPGEAEENAAKEAETDALKRAVRLFGTAFGLSLYDKASPLHRGGEDDNAIATQEDVLSAWTDLGLTGLQLSEFLQEKGKQQLGEMDGKKRQKLKAWLWSAKGAQACKAWGAAR